MKRLLPLIIVLICLTAKASVSNTPDPTDTTVNILYPTPICINWPGTVDVIMTGTGNYLGGVFSSSTGLVINPVTGSIDLAASAPGNYIVTYDLPYNVIDNQPAITVSTVVILVLPVVPYFADIPAFCYGSTPPSMPTVSLNGISGTWTYTQSVVLNTITTTYYFTPYIECASPVVMSTTQIQPDNSIYTESGSNTVYVDSNSNVVVLPVTLFSGVSPDGYTFEWFVDGTSTVVGTSDTYTVSTASSNGEDRTFTVQITNTATGCSSTSAGFVVHQSNGTPPPAGIQSQTLPPGSTLGDLVVSGNNIQWYASASGKNVNTMFMFPLPLNTVLLNNATYYASQTVNGEESLERLPVTVHLALGIGESELVSLTYSPNPVKSSLTIKNKDIINSISVVNILGQVLRTTTHNQAEVVEDMSGFETGTYFIRVTSENKTESFKIIKE